MCALWLVGWWIGSDLQRLTLYKQCTLVSYVDVLSSSDSIVHAVIATNGTCRMKVERNGDYARVIVNLASYVESLIQEISFSWSV